MPKHAFYIADFVDRCIEFWCWLFASHVHFLLLCQTAARAPLQDSNCLNCSVLANQWKMGRRIFAYAKSAMNKNSGHKYLIYQSVWLAAILSWVQWKWGVIVVAAATIVGFLPIFCCWFFFLIVRCNCLIIDFWHISSQKRPATARPVLIPLQWSVMLCEHALVRVPLKIGSGAKHYILQRVLSVHCVLSPFVPFLLMRRIGFLWALSFVQSHSKPFLVRVCESLFCCLISFEFFFLVQFTSIQMN